MISEWKYKNLETIFTIDHITEQQADVNVSPTDCLLAMGGDVSSRNRTCRRQGKIKRSAKPSTWTCRKSCHDHGWKTEDRISYPRADSGKTSDVRRKRQRKTCPERRASLCRRNKNSMHIFSWTRHGVGGFGLEEVTIIMVSMPKYPHT